ncbi:xanthine dehydrogenase family protein subunit M [soil metagenome]
MIPVSFEYQRPSTVDEVLAALSADSKILAGGHSLLPAMKLRLNQPSKLVDITRIDALKGIKQEDGEIVIGAGSTHAEIADDSLIQNQLPFFAAGASMIGDLQVRNHGTIGGSLAHADPSADWSALVLAADATIEVQNKTGRKTIKAAVFFTGLFATALEEGDIITAIRVPVPAPGTKTTYQKFPQPASRFALVGCAVMRTADGKTKIAYTGVSDNAFRDNAAEAFISGKALTEANIVDAANVAVENVSVMSDHYASEEYRKHLAKVYLKKALQAIA